MSTASFAPPKYFEISREIIGHIQRGELPVGKPVPSEREIIERHQVSNTTAWKVLHELEKAGWVSRIKGRGTFVRNYAAMRPRAKQCQEAAANLVR
jgi:DNA-binding GntR family transcriptional regulator